MRVTTQLTSKKLKLNLLLSNATMVFSGFCAIMDVDGPAAGTFAAAFVIGFFWNLITRALIWWNHD